MLLRKEEEDYMRKMVWKPLMTAASAQGDGAGAEGVDSCEIDATLKRSGDKESLPGNYGENVCN